MMRFFGILAGAALASTALGTACTPSPGEPPEANVSVVHRFPKPSWAENLAVRDNGLVLVSRFDTPSVWQLDPTTGDAALVYAWNSSEYSGCLGITEAGTDIFYVAAAAFYDDTFTKTNGTNSIFKIDMTTFTASGSAVTSNATVTKTIDIDVANVLNGMTTYDDATLLVADPLQGIVYEILLAEGRYVAAVEDPKMKYDYLEGTTSKVGVNGIKMFRSYLYWTNTAGGYVARVAFNSLTGATGNSTSAIANVPLADDFIINDDGIAFVCQSQADTLSVAYLDFQQGNGSGVAEAYAIGGSNTSTVLAGVSAAQFGRRASDANRLYLSTTGAEGNKINGTVTVGATLSYIDTSNY